MEEEGKLRHVLNLIKTSIFKRTVGILSCSVGLLCYALSSSFKSLFGEWNPTKIVLYLILSSIISVIVLFAPKGRDLVVSKLKPHVEFLVLMLTSLYSYFADRSTKDKPDTWSVVSSVAFALTLLCLSLQRKPGLYVGMFSFFLGCFTVQLMKIHLIFILVAAGICYPLVFLESYSESPSENGYSRPEGLIEILIDYANSASFGMGHQLPEVEATEQFLWDLQELPESQQRRQQLRRLWLLQQQQCGRLRQQQQRRRQQQNSMLSVVHSIFGRTVGCLSCVAGLLCYALSSPFKSFFGEWNPTKIVIYTILSSIISVLVLFAPKSRDSVVSKLKPHVEFLVLMLTSLYSFFADRSMKDKPDTWSVVSSVAFALTSLCLSLQIKPGSDVGLFSFFLGCFTVQLINIHLIFILVAAGICYLLVVLGSYSESQSKNGYSSAEERVEIRHDDGNRASPLQVLQQQLERMEPLLWPLQLEQKEPLQLERKETLQEELVVQKEVQRLQQQGDRLEQQEQDWVQEELQWLQQQWEPLQLEQKEPLQLERKEPLQEELVVQKELQGQQLRDWLEQPEQDLVLEEEHEEPLWQELQLEALQLEQKEEPQWQELQWEALQLEQKEPPQPDLQEELQWLSQQWEPMELKEQLIEQEQLRLTRSPFSFLPFFGRFFDRREKLE